MKSIIEVVEHDMAAILRSKSEAERLRIGWGMWASARAMLDNLLQREHPDWSIPLPGLEA
jgi:hypothetical protein